MHLTVLFVLFAQDSSDGDFIIETGVKNINSGGFSKDLVDACGVNDAKNNDVVPADFLVIF